MKAGSRQAIVGDIGGTHARFAIADLDTLTLRRFVVFDNDRFGSLEMALRAYMASIPDRPTLAGFAIAGPVVPGELRLTNRAWTFTRETLKAAAVVERLHVVNDFEAVALSLPHLADRDLHRLGGGEPVIDAPRVAVGPGTGLGVAGLVSAPSGWVALGTEGGHVSFPVSNARELAIVERIRGSDAHVSAEDLISGPGLVRLYRVLGGIAGQRVQPIAAPDIVSSAGSGADPVARDALDLFVGWLGRFAGDMALAYGARGGVYLGGGIAPKIIEWLDTDGFRKAFVSKGRLTSLLERIPIHVIMAEDAGLRGAAVALSMAEPLTSNAGEERDRGHPP